MHIIENELSQMEKKQKETKEGINKIKADIEKLEKDSLENL